MENIKLKANKRIKLLAKEIYDKEMFEIEKIENKKIYFSTSISCSQCSCFLELLGELPSMYNEKCVKGVVDLKKPDVLCFLNNKRICHTKYLVYKLGMLEEKENIDINKLLDIKE